MRFASAENATSLASPLKHRGIEELQVLENAIENATALLRNSAVGSKGYWEQ